MEERYRVPELDNIEGRMTDDPVRTGEVPLTFEGFGRDELRERVEGAHLREVDERFLGPFVVVFDERDLEPVEY